MAFREHPRLPLVFWLGKGEAGLGDAHHHIAGSSFRARQFVIAVVGAGLVFAMTLLLWGMAAGFRVEIIQTVEAMGGPVVGPGRRFRGPDRRLSPIPDRPPQPWPRAPVYAVGRPLIVVPQAAQIAVPGESVNLIGHLPRGLGGPTPIRAGRRPAVKLWSTPA